jgi:hypothetical protein
MPDRPAMKNLAPAFARIARIDAQSEILLARRNTEIDRIRKECVRVARIAIKRAGLVRGKTLISDGKWRMGIYQGTSIDYPPSVAGKKWPLHVHYQSVQKDGRAGKRRERHLLYLDHPGDIGGAVQIVGKMTDGKAVWNG